MIVKFHPRGRGGGAGPVDYLLGKDRQREGASVLQGKPEEVRELIDASPYVKKYT
ncbi:nuclease, partial [Salmonella enterica subsp. enterica serovar Havana]|nr:nuclease [Salmonella enterica subsp. enterica serovar Havana]